MQNCCIVIKHLEHSDLLFLKIQVWHGMPALHTESCFALIVPKMLILAFLLEKKFVLL